MKKSLFYLLLFIQCSIGCLFHLNGMKKKEYVVSAHYIHDTNFVEVQLNDNKIQELPLLQKHIPCVIQFSRNGRYLVALMENTSQIDCNYDPYCVGVTNEIEYPKYSVIVWFATKKIPYYGVCCCFKFDHRFAKEVRFSHEETMIVVDFDNGSSVDFYPNLIVCDEDLSIDIKKSMENGSLREILPQHLNPVILNKFIDTILDIEN